MSCSWRENSQGSGEASSRGIVRRMVSLPRTVIGEFSRAVGQGMDMMGLGSRRRQPIPINYPAHPLEEHLVSAVPDEWAFLTAFEQQYGPSHPFFYTCRLTEALKIAEQDKKFLFLYLHSKEHPLTPSFCRETLCSELMVQFLDANFICWGGLAHRGEGSQMAATLQPGSFPFCALVAPAPGNSIAVLRQIEGPISPFELVEILQRTVEEQGPAFGLGSSKAEQEEKVRADRRLREEQDAAYLAALKIDKDKELRKSSQIRDIGRKPVESPKKHYQKPTETRAAIDSTDKVLAPPGKNPQTTQILIRFPNGEKREQSFSCSDEIRSVFRYIDSLGLSAIGPYRLVSSFPRKTYGADQIGMTLRDAGLYPRASLFLEAL
ncbi:plant UBX domain-containing protein 10-like [Punica granatum]|uniref:Plant UBX domain-containing protein 10-like n=1 Tax=Punica granatum TaxID=22663 RepID=A0A218XZS8_PUNGR|nr:plant UBX domain-containing protein 10-like [Punica granatum]OWM90513.1 hypothetical protein CDL15_Pgr014816 [Punica granatum]